MFTKSKNAIFEELFDVLPFSVYIVDVATYSIVYANKQMQKAVGKEDLIDRKCYKQIFNYSSPCPHCKMDQLVENNEPNGQTIVLELFNETNDCWYQIMEKSLVWIDGRIVKYSIAFEINELKSAQNNLAEAHAQLSLKNKELQELSKTDTLSGLYNRLKLAEVMEYELKRAKRYQRPLSIIILDIDDFKQVNDNLGHLIGDKVLQELAQILSNNIREADSVFRWGGEEFLLLCPETDAREINILAESIREVIAGQEFEQKTSITVSLGTTSIQDNDTYELMFSRADRAMFNSKARGKNTSTHF